MSGRPLKGPDLQNIPIRTKLGDEIRRISTDALERRPVRSDYSAIERRILALRRES